MGTHATPRRLDRHRRIGFVVRGTRVRRLRRWSTTRGRRDNTYLWDLLVLASRTRAIHLAQRLSVCHATPSRVGGTDCPRPVLVRHAAPKTRKHAREPACDDARRRAGAPRAHTQQVPLAFWCAHRTGSPHDRGGGGAHPARRIRRTGLADPSVLDHGRLYRRHLLGVVSPRFLESVRSPHAHLDTWPRRGFFLHHSCPRDSGRRCHRRRWS